MGNFPSASPPLPVLNFSGEKVGESFLDLRFAPPDTARVVVIFGPKAHDWCIKINCKEKRLAISTAVANVVASAVVVEDFAAEFAEKPKTKEFIAAMKLLQERE
ncbi:50S ribosomal protein L4, chloroplastic [Glycine soja]|uniref:50S ribosomal protein L4, chloroplastic n=1 Tax=Glycine soja TaxID=3848 RepID=A0A0B2QIQ5_GLYSO|nr:50S ribosomal protein L4, chloroplastic [Glycine soja]